MYPQQAGEKGTTLTLYEMRKLRYRHLELTPEWEKIVYGHDLLILFPQLSATTLIQ
jgi:hypothetical protein